MNAALPALQVIIPLLTAPVCLLVARPRAAGALALVAIWSAFAIACQLFSHALDGGVISYSMGGWEPPWGIEYRIDAANALVLVVVTAVASVSLPAGLVTKADGIETGRMHLFCAAFLVCVAGLLGIAITGDAFNVFVFLEISSLASYTLVGIGKKRHALTAAFSYLVMGTIGGTFILIAIGLMYQMTGTLNMADLSARLPELSGVRTIRVAFAFMAIGIAIKLAVFPLHQWLPNAYAYAPSAVSALLAGTATKVIYYLLARVVFTLFGAAFVFEVLRAGTLLLALSIAAMFGGSLAAIYQRDVKRLLAYSSIAQIGYLTLALSLGTEKGIAAGFMHLFNHAVMKTGMFLAVACIVFRVGSAEISALKGIGRRMPLTLAAFVIGGLGLIGVPSTAGFVSKWYLVLAALDSGRFAVAGSILASSLLAVVYVWRIIEVAYFEAPPESSTVVEAPPSLLAPAWIAAAATIYFGIFTDIPTRAATLAASQLFGGSP